MHLQFIRKTCFNPYFCGACILFRVLIVARAQLASGERVVRVTDFLRITDPVMITNISVDGKPIECRLFIKPPGVFQAVTPFEAGGNWLSQMILSLINRTDKTIVFGGIDLDFLDTGDCRTQPCVGAQLDFGQRPAIDAYDGRTGQPLKPEHPERPPLNWKRGQTITIRVSDYMPQIEEDLSNFMSVTAVTKMNVHRLVFYFDDGMEWSLGRYSVPDPERPGKFNPLPASYFPGKRGHNWPPGYNN
jgi:hypothetical protein